MTKLAMCREQPPSTGSLEVPTMEVDDHRAVRDGNTFSIIDRESKTLARCKFSVWRRTAAFDVHGKGFIAYFKGWKEMVLEREDGSMVVSATPKFNVAAAFAYDGYQYELRKEKWTDLGNLLYLYRDDGVRVAGFDRPSLYPGKMLVKFANGLPLEINAFLLWVALLRWDNLPSG
jgi:hypothetical protein